MANISKAKAVELIYIEIERGINYTKALARFKPELSLDKETFKSYWKEAKAKYEARVKMSIEAVAKSQATRIMHALETKEGQVIDLIRQIDDLEKDLANGFVTDARWVANELVHDKRPMLDKEKVEKVALIAKLKADIRKILGLDAPKESNVKVETDIDKLFKTGDAGFAEDPEIKKPFKRLKES